MQTGNPVSKNTQNPGTLRGIKQYISTYLFDKPQMREQIPIEKPVNSNHMIQIRSPLQVKGREIPHQLIPSGAPSSVVQPVRVSLVQGSNQMKKINIIVPISLGRLETIHRFLGIWNDLFKQDKNQKLILSFSGTDAEHRTDISINMQ